jgi:hypothetical protein
MENKPLGHRSYGSIPHLPGSRLGQGDYHISEGQARIATEKTRDKHDRVIVQEKLDGSNVAVAKVDGKILAITRAGYVATTSKYQQHHIFAKWVELNAARFDSVLQEGERICGEWLAQAHGTRYNLPHEPFVAFDLMQKFDPIRKAERATWDEFINRVGIYFDFPFLVGKGPMLPDKAIKLLDPKCHGAIDPIEGLIYRVERHGKVDFLTKYVRHDKQDGKYMPEHNGTGQPIWNIDITPYL